LVFADSDLCLSEFGLTVGEIDGPEFVRRYLSQRQVLARPQKCSVLGNCNHPAGDDHPAHVADCDDGLGRSKTRWLCLSAAYQRGYGARQVELLRSMVVRLSKPSQEALHQLPAVLFCNVAGPSRTTNSLRAHYIGRSSWSYSHPAGCLLSLLPRLLFVSRQKLNLDLAGGVGYTILDVLILLYSAVSRQGTSTSTTEVQSRTIGGIPQSVIVRWS
jgi:hypothetical protein